MTHPMTHPLDSQYVRAAIEEKLRRTISTIVNEEAATAAERVATRVRELTDELALSILEEYSIAENNKQLTITVRRK